jgi:hypothetical protein
VGGDIGGVCQVAWGLQIMVAPNIMRSSHGLLLTYIYIYIYTHHLQFFPSQAKPFAAMQPRAKQIFSFERLKKLGEAKSKSLIPTIT